MSRGNDTKVRRLRAGGWKSIVAATAAVGLLGASGGGGQANGATRGPSPATATTEPATTEGQPQPGGEIVIGMEGTWPPLDPLTVAALAERSIASTIYDTLLSFGEDGSIQPWLATEWSTDDDGQTWTLTMREGVVFHDGTPLDAAAVKAHFDRAMNPDNGCFCLADLALLESVEAPDPTTLVFSLAQPYGAFPAVLADYSSMIESPSAVAELGEGFGAQPVGSGPYRFVSEVTGDSVVVERNEDYWRDDVGYLDRITFKVLPDTDARFAALRAGDIDIMRLPDPDHIAQAREAGELQVVDIGGLGTVFVMFNTKEAPFDDVRARRAVIHASDMDAINEVLFSGGLEHTTSFIPPNSWAHSEPSTYPAYDPEQAAALVEELGGIAFTLTTTADRLDLAQALQAMWAEAGIEVEIETMDQATSVARAGDSDFMAHLYRNPGRFDPDLFVYPTFHSTAARNYVQLEDPEVDRILEEARASVDQDERAALYAEFAELIGEQATHNFIHAISTSYLAGPTVQGIPAHPDWVLRPAGVWLQD